MSGTHRRIADQWSQGDEPRLNTMRTLVLLDLLGAKQPALTWHFENTRPLFGGMQSVESKLRNLSLVRGQGCRRPTRRVSYPDGVGGEGDRMSAGDKATDARAVTPYMSSNGRRGGLSDDHVPFMRKGIPVVHLIDSPFPSVIFNPKPRRLHPAPPASTSPMLRTLLRQSISCQTCVYLCPWLKSIVLCFTGFRKNFVGPLTPRGTFLNLEQIWHTDRDNLEAVDPATLGDLTAIIKAFVVEYYALEP